MELTREEEMMLSGDYGEGSKRAIEVLVKLGEFYGAKRLIPVSMAYVVIGPSATQPGKSREWLRELADLGATFRCPTFVPMDEAVEGDYDYLTHKKLGAVFAFHGGGHARNIFYTPVFGQHIVGDGTAVTHYMNSYIGARSNTECFIGQHAAAIVGKTPEYGFHLTENRLGKTLFEVQVELKDETDWSALGYYISKKLGKNYWDVPVINRVKPCAVTNDELLAISSSIPAYGACVHSLLVGISPEALTLEQAFGGKEPKETYIVGPAELNEVYTTFSPEKDTPDMVSIGGFGANASIDSVIKFATLLEGKKVSQNFPTVILMDCAVQIVADKMGYTDILRKAGVKIGMGEFLEERGLDASVMSNIPIMSAKRLGLKTIVFADAKSCHYIGNQGVNSVLKHIEDCAKIALSGRIEV